jgi:hypothetical protein
MFGDEAEVGMKGEESWVSRRPCLHVRVSVHSQWPRVGCRGFSFGVRRSIRRRNPQPLAVPVLRCAITFPP